MTGRPFKLTPEVEAYLAANKPSVEPLAYSLEDAGKALGGVSVKTLFRWVRQGKLKVSKIGGRTLVRRAELDRLLDSGEQKGPADAA